MQASLWLLGVAVFFLLVAEKGDRAGLRAVSKLTASTAFLTLAVAGGAFDNSYGWAIFGALLASWIGDACLLSARKSIFMVGLFSFLGGHFAFAAAFLVRGVDWSWALGGGAAVVVFAVFVDRWLSPKVDANFKLPVRAYIAVITLMAALAYGCWGAGHHWALPLGATAFFLSDITVALDRFVEPRFVNRLVGLPLYYGAQALLAWSVSLP